MKRLTWYTFGVLLSGLLQVWHPQPASATILLSFDPKQGLDRVGETLFVNLNADITGSDAFVSFGLDINFNAAVLSAVSASLNATIFPDPQLPPDLSTDGVVTLTGFVPFPSPPVSGSLTFATIEFLIKEFGSSPLTISFSGPTQGFGLPFPPGDVIVPDPGNLGTATIRAVPEPHALTLVLIGLLGLIYKSWRREERAKP